MATRLTDRQREVLAYIGKESAVCGRPPTVREICGHFGFRSPRAASCHLEALEKKGWIRREANRSRAIRLMHDPRGIPIVGRVAAGHPILSPEHYEGTLDLSRLFGVEDRFAVKVTGDSMTGCGICDGDHVIVQRASQVGDGQIALVYVEGEATVKRVFRERDGFRLEPENPDYDVLFVDEQTPEFQIAGPVVGVVRTY